jgi:hypothetical protein
MKTLSGTFAFVVLAVVAIVLVITFRAFAQPTQPGAGKKFTLNIGRTTDDYVDVDKDAFDKALKHLSDDGGDYQIKFKDSSGKVTDPYKVSNIKTDKITTSALAQNAPAGESAANDPNVTHRLSSDSAPDIKAVLDTFK